MVYGVASWLGPGIDFTDGLCHACAGDATSELGVSPGPASTSPRRATAIVAALFFLLAPEVLDQFPTSVLPLPAFVRPSTLVPEVLSIRPAAANEPPAPAPDVAAMLAIVTGAATAVDGPVAAPPRASAYTSALLPSLPPMRWELHHSDDPGSRFRAYSLQAP